LEDKLNRNDQKEMEKYIFPSLTKTYISCNFNKNFQETNVIKNTIPLKNTIYFALFHWKVNGLITSQSDINGQSLTRNWLSKLTFPADKFSNVKFQNQKSISDLQKRKQEKNFLSNLTTQ